MERNSVLLTSESIECMEKFLNDKQWLSQWFTDINPWKSIYSIRKRLIWVQLDGVPLDIWTLDFFFNGLEVS